jgi:hypothetical protein
MRIFHGLRPEVISTIDAVLGLTLLKVKFRSVTGYPGRRGMSPISKWALSPVSSLVLEAVRCGPAWQCDATPG